MIILAVLAPDVAVVLGRRKALASAALVVSITLALFLLLEIWKVNARDQAARTG